MGGLPAVIKLPLFTVRSNHSHHKSHDNRAKTKQIKRLRAFEEFIFDPHSKHVFLSAPTLTLKSAQGELHATKWKTINHWSKYCDVLLITTILWKADGS